MNTEQVVERAVSALQDTSVIQLAQNVSRSIKARGDSLGGVDYATVLQQIKQGSGETLRGLVEFLKQGAPVVWEVMRNKVYSEMWVCLFVLVEAWVTFLFVAVITRNWGKEGSEVTMPGGGCYKWGLAARIVAFVVASVVGMVYAPTIIRLWVATDYYTVGAFLQLMEKVK